MSDETKVASEAATAESINATAVAAEALQKAQEAQMLAVVTKAFEATFNITDNNGQRRFLDVTRVPLICQSIVGISQKLESIEENMVTKEVFWPVKVLVYGFVGLSMTAIVGALFALVIK
jgi:hypothetical protein